MGCLKSETGETAALDFLQGFVEDVKTTGLVQELIDPASNPIPSGCRSPSALHFFLHMSMVAWCALWNACWTGSVSSTLTQVLTVAFLKELIDKHGVGSGLSVAH